MIHYRFKTTLFILKLLMACILAFLLGCLISCSSAKSSMTETAAIESLSSLETTRDSVGSNIEMQTSASGYLDISDLQILFYPPEAFQSPILKTDSAAAQNPEALTRQRPKILYPALINIARLSAGSEANALLKASSDSVGSSLSDIRHNESTTAAEKRIRDPTRPSWPVMLSLFIALIIIVYTGFMLYQSNRL